MEILESSSLQESLKTHQKSFADIHLRDLFAQDKNRAKRFSISAADLFLDYSKNIITTETIELLLEYAEEKNLSKKIAALLKGDIVNKTEKRAALHTALRQQNDQPIYHEKINIIPEIRAIQNKIKHICEQVITGEWRGFSGEKITDIVNIGIGGSELGPALATNALKPYANKNLQCHFLANIDATQILELFTKLPPQSTLFIISSKSFSTQETLQNATSVKNWLRNAAGNHNVRNHFIAITAKRDLALEWGVAAENILPIWDWVGGRFSLWSAIGLPIALSIGYENFQELLRGAYAMDQHFATAPLQQNMPVILGLLSVWYSQYFNAQSHAILPYEQNLQLLPNYLQQSHMESLGKTRCNDGTAVKYATGAVIWGGVGTQGQHTFHQLLHQGTHFVPADFIIAAQSHQELQNHHNILWANCLSQSQALMCGKNYQEVYSELLSQGFSEADALTLTPHKIISGNRPSNMIILQKLTPFSLGALIALYEHKIFTQSVLWDINCFDQWGVELGKQLAHSILSDLQNSQIQNNYDSSTQQLIEYYRCHSERM